jgi:hypothetical protein
MNTSEIFNLNEVWHFVRNEIQIDLEAFLKDLSNFILND